MSAIPIIDVFAGPGGLAEGFSSLKVNGRAAFRIALSVEKDPGAYETLRLRGFYRQFPDGPPAEYWAHLRGELTRSELFKRFPTQYRQASAECVLHELGPATDVETRTLVRKALKGYSGPWGLIGGPPCQAYSLVGRSRNRGISGYVPEADHRQTLYVEYLQILADHRPAFFVMENVKGLLSARLQSEGLFERILGDLRDPATALRREDRRAPTGGPEYEIFSVTRPPSGLFGPVASDMVVRAEEHGIPQARHRVILLGVRTGVSTRGLRRLDAARGRTLWNAIGELPKIRSGLTELVDDDRTWADTVRSIPRRAWVRELDSEVRACLEDAANRIRSFPARRGGEFVRGGRNAPDALGGYVNHSARAHITGDLERYFFAACFAKVHGRSPVLQDFPEPLLPAHSSTSKAVTGSYFNDRFRVQLRDRPSTTVTSEVAPLLCTA